MESLNGTIKPSGNLTGEEIPVIIKEKTVVEKDYENLDNKPSINDVILEGNKTPAELGLTKVSDFELYKQSVDRSFRGVSESIRSVKTESKTYTDNEIAAAKAYSDGKNSDLETAINETINNKDNATRAYASHLVSEESYARETADEETLTASKSYTDTAVVKEVTKGPASSLEFEGLQEGIPFPKIILTVPDEYVYEEGKTAHSINICCNNHADPDATELYAENMLVVAKSNTVEIGYDDTIKLLKQVPGKCVVGFSNEEDAAVCTLTVTGALKYEALKRIYSECWNRIDVEKDNMEGYVRGYTDTEITKCKEYTDKKIAEVSGGDITAKGNPVQLDGLQGGVPFSEITVSGKNLLKYPYMTESGKVTSGVTFTANSDGSITLNGTSTAYGSFNFTSRLTNDLLLNGTYTLSGATADAKLAINATRDGKATTIIRTQSSSIFTTSYHDNDNEYGFAVFVEFNAGKTFDNLTIFPQLELGSTATEYEPPITGRELKVNASGKNLLKYPYYDTTKTINGVTFTDNGDGSVLVNGTATAYVYFSLNSNKAFPAGKYVLSKSRDNVLIYIDKYLNNAFYQRIATSIETVRELIFNVSEEDAQKYTYRFGIQLNKDNIADNVTIYPQLELGDTATEYEPYHGESYTITPYTNPYTISNDIRQQDGLNNISVSAGTLSVTGVRKNAAIKRIWEKLGELTTSISYTDEKIGNINTILESVTGGAE